MGISGIASTNSMSVVQMTAADLKDQKSKNIQTEITNAQQQLQKLSSAEDLSAHEKIAEQKKLQKEISGLNTKLKQHQEELRSSQKREITMARLREDEKPAKEDKSENRVQAEEVSADAADKKPLPLKGQQTAPPEAAASGNADGRVILKGVSQPEPKKRDTDTERKQTDETGEETIDAKAARTPDTYTDADETLSGKEVHAMVSADSFLQQADRQGTVVTRTRDGIAVLKGEIKLDEFRDTNTERKQAELRKMEQQEQRETEFQFSLLGNASNAIKPAAETNISPTGQTQANAPDQLHVSGLSPSQEEQAAQQRFYVSIV